jgi:type II pantothenate kinase
MEENTAKILLDQTRFNVPSDTIGIDVGQSLTKIAIRKDNEIILKIGETNLKSIIEFVDENKSKFSTINFTGGKAYKLYKKYSTSTDANLINEFEANIRGLEFLYESFKKKALPPSLIVTLGTGTSMVLKNDKIEHLGGSSMGGGFFMGLLKLLFNLDDYFDAIEIARKGNRFNIDLKVADIYDIEDTRVNKLFREFTAASLGKIKKDFDVKSLKKEDLISSLIGIIGESIGTIATLMAENHNMKNIVFCGGFLLENKPLKQILSLLCKFKRKKAIFLKNSEYCGALGALFL